MTSPSAQLTMIDEHIRRFARRRQDDGNAADSTLSKYGFE